MVGGCVFKIDGIEPEENEKASEVFQKVRDLVKDHAPEIPDQVLDRAHRIGPVVETKDKKKHQSIIVRFSTFRYGTLFYLQRKSMNYISIRLDLTKKRYDMLKSARDMVIDKENVNFVYADINCRLKVRFKSGHVQRV